MKNITDLRTDLLQVYEGLRDGSIEVKTAKELSNSAGKIINSVRVELDYVGMRGETPNIDFMQSTATQKE